MERPVKDRTGRMSMLRAREQLYLVRRENLIKRQKNITELIGDNQKKLEKVKKEIREIVHGKQ